MSPGSRARTLSSSRRVAGTLVLVLVVVMAAFSLRVRLTFGAWLIIETPTHFALCEQTYTRFDDRARTFAEAVTRDPEAQEAIVLGPTLDRLPVDVPQPSRFRRGAGYNGCGHLVLLHVAPDGYALDYKLGSP